MYTEIRGAIDYAMFIIAYRFKSYERRVVPYSIFGPSQVKGGKGNENSASISRLLVAIVWREFAGYVLGCKSSGSISVVL